EPRGLIGETKQCRCLEGNVFWNYCAVLLRSTHFFRKSTKLKMGKNSIANSELRHALTNGDYAARRGFSRRKRKRRFVLIGALYNHKIWIVYVSRNHIDQ